ASIRREKAEIENILGLDIRSDLERKPVSQLGEVLKRIGLKLSKVGTQKVDGGRKIYRYQLDPAALHLLQGIVGARSATKGWVTVYRMQGWAADHDQAADDVEEQNEADWDNGGLRL